VVRSGPIVRKPAFRASGLNLVVSAIVHSNSAGHCPRKEVMRMSKVKIGRNAGTGKFTTVKTATNNPKTHVVETIKK
jgi:hypothetical protein